MTAEIVRSDVCPVASAAVIGEAVTAITLAQALKEKFGSDSLRELQDHLPANMDELERNGRVVLLTASPETILKRLDLGAVPRPLLAGADPVVRVKKLLAQRQPVYARNSLTVSTDGLDENQVVDLIVKWAKQEEWT
jgi:hypothetical protein